MGWLAFLAVALFEALAAIWAHSLWDGLLATASGVAMFVLTGLTYIYVLDKSKKRYSGDCAPCTIPLRPRCERKAKAQSRPRQMPSQSVAKTVTPRADGLHSSRTYGPTWTTYRSVRQSVYGCSKFKELKT